MQPIKIYRFLMQSSRRKAAG